MQRISEIVDIYLKTDTNYALLLTGEWGIGKTYYYKNILRNSIKQTPVYSDNSKKYKPILVSLFGLKSIEEIQTEIFLSLFPYLKNKKVKLAASIGKSLLKGIMQLKNLGEYYNYVADTDISKTDWINFQELVICFDDLERISKDLNLEELLGFINSLVENENVKILIIANEGKIEDHQYKIIKEKVIGNTIEFIPEFLDTYDSVLINKFQGFPVYKTFLEKNKQYILETFTSNSNNLRILIFALNYFHTIFSELEKTITSEKELKANKLAILENLMRFTLAVSIEYKEGKITYKSRQKIDDTKALSIAELMKQTWADQSQDKKETEKEKKYSEIFLAKYFKNKQYYFYNSVYDFVTGGSALITDDFIKEIKILFTETNKKKLPQHDLLDKLTYQACYSLSNKDYIKLTRNMLNYAYQGQYDLPQCLTIFHFATRFKNPLNLNPKILEKKLLIAMRKKRSVIKHEHFLGEYLSISENAEFKDHLSAIRAEAQKLNEEARQNANFNDLQILEKLCYTNFTDFYQKVLDNKQSLYYEPVFTHFSPTKFYHFFLNSSNEDKWTIVRFFASRYESSHNLHPQESNFIKKIKAKVEVKTKQFKGKNIEGFIWSEFDTILEKIIRLY